FIFVLAARLTLTTLPLHAALPIFALDVCRGARVQLVHDGGSIDHLIAVASEANADVPAGRDDRPVPAEAPADLYDAVLDDENAGTRAVAGEAERWVARADVP